VALNPIGQYRDQGNLEARQRLWQYQDPHFDLVGWVLDVADIGPGQRVLDVGCGNGVYLEELRTRNLDAVGCDLSLGMIKAARPHSALANADVVALPFADEVFERVLAPHMLYHVDDRERAVHELRRVLAPGGVLVVVTNGSRHIRQLRALVERAVRRATPDWELQNPSTHAFSLDNGGEQLRWAFDSVTVLRPMGASAPVRVRDAAVAADYVASVADHYQDSTSRPWVEVVEDVRRDVQDAIDRTGAFTVTGDAGCFVCR
jgi:SAM-dependent methyltransferase